MAGVNTVPGLGVNVEYSKDGTTFYKIPYAGTFSTSGGDPNVIEGETFDGPFKRVGNMRVPDATIEFPSYVPNHQSWKDLMGQANDNNAPVHYKLATMEEKLYEASGAANTVAIDTAGAVTFAGDKPDFTSDNYGPGMVIALYVASRGTVVANTSTVEYVYKATAANAAPATPIGGATTDDFAPTGWSASDIAPTPALPYVWRSTRTQTGGAWDADDFAAPVLFSSSTRNVNHIDTIADDGTVTVRPAPDTAVAATASYKIINPALTKTFIARFRTPVHDNVDVGGIMSSTLELALTGVLPDWSIVA